MTDNTQEIEELYDNWFYSLAHEEPDGTYTLTVHEVHDGEAYSKLEELITSYTKQRELALLERLESLSITVLPETYPTGSRVSIDAIPLSATQKEKEKLR